MSRTGSLGSLRERNRLASIDILSNAGGQPGRDLAPTGLSRSTVSSIVADLQTTGLVVDYDGELGPPNAPQGGSAPDRCITLDPSAGAIVGIDFGSDDLRVAVADLSHTVLAEPLREMRRATTPTSGSSSRRGWYEAVRREPRAVRAGGRASAWGCPRRSIGHRNGRIVVDPSRLEVRPSGGGYGASGCR